MTPSEVLLDPKPQSLSAEQALHIARLDADARRSSRPSCDIMHSEGKS
jgi:hypothetical protein